MEIGRERERDGKRMNSRYRKENGQKKVTNNE